MWRATERDSPNRLTRYLFLNDAVEAKVRRSDYTPIDQMPQDLKNAVMAVEDNRFFDHRIKLYILVYT